MSLSTVLGPRFTDVPQPGFVPGRWFHIGEVVVRQRRYMCITGETVLHCQLSSQLSFSGDTLYMFTEFMH